MATSVKKLKEPALQSRIVNGIEFHLIGDNWVGMIPMELIVPYHDNPRRNSHAVPGVKRSIDSFRQLQDLVVIPGDHEGARSCKPGEFEIVVGHTRHLSLIELERDEAKCVLADHLTAQQVSEYRIADNSLGDLSDWNFDLLKTELEQLSAQGTDMSLFGFSDDQLKLYMDDWETNYTPNPQGTGIDSSASIRVKIMDPGEVNRALEIIKEALTDAAIAHEAG